MKQGKICTFTGHRDVADGEVRRVSSCLRATIRRLYAEGVRVFRAGGAVGFDMIAALVVLDMKKELDISLHLYLPCRDQTRFFSNKDKKYYAYILDRCDGFLYVSDAYTNGCMLERNRRMLEGADVCVAYLKHSHGGTAYTVNQAHKMGIRVININDID